MKLDMPPLSVLGRGAALALTLTIALSGCSEARKALGYDKTPPDEFAVVARAPLSMPPDYSLRPPAPGATRPQEGSTRDQARLALLGASTPSGVGPRANAAQTAGQSALLRQAGADKAVPEIRSTVDHETLALAKADRTFTDRLMFWRDHAPAGEQIDAAAEAQRLAEAKALGKTGADAAPQIERRGHGWLEGIW